ncbi:hypothetical protein IQ22_02701 [Pseudomonas duriflava]|uniref:CrfX protein n=1 Tax=Pseudomonas duriflava TaxID=459528 RepID=A0A562Q9U9_9PSED|nr:CrfX protein [Pseudomonas duriflava]TWI53484.1 hypothetical protein IQ22_02701 [Pseudomonas duriflava]
MHDPFEKSLKDMLSDTSDMPDDKVRLDRVLKTANRQIGAGDLFSLIGRWATGCLIAINSGAGHVSPVSRRGSGVSQCSAKKVE